MHLKLSKKLKGKQEKKDGCYRVVDLNLYRKEKWGLDKVVYLNNKNFTRKKTEKKMVLTDL